jgi:hypothetical protein
MKTRIHSIESPIEKTSAKENPKAIWLSAFRRFWNAFLAGAGYCAW